VQRRPAPNAGVRVDQGPKLGSAETIAASSLPRGMRAVAISDRVRLCGAYAGSGIAYARSAPGGLRTRDEESVPYDAMRGPRCGPPESATRRLIHEPSGREKSLLPI